MLVALSLTIFFVGLVLFLQPGTTNIFVGFAIMMCSGVSVPCVESSGYHRARYETSVHLTQSDLQDNYLSFIDKVKESESIIKTARDLGKVHEQEHQSLKP